jgi:hypothetical protein
MSKFIEKLKEKMSKTTDEASSELTTFDVSSGKLQKTEPVGTKSILPGTPFLLLISNNT